MHHLVYKYRLCWNRKRIQRPHDLTPFPPEAMVVLNDDRSPTVLARWMEDEIERNTELLASSERACKRDEDVNARTRFQAVKLDRWLKRFDDHLHLNPVEKRRRLVAACT